MKSKKFFSHPAGRLALFFWLALLLAACSTGDATIESVPQTLPENTTAPDTVPTSEPTAQETSADLQVTNTPAAAAETTPAASPTVPETGLSDDPRQAVISAMNAMREAGSYRVHVNSTSSEITTEWDAEVILPDRFHLIMDFGEFIIIGNKTYMKQGNEWSEFPVDIGSMVFTLLSTTDEEAEASISDVQAAGTDTVNGEATSVYQYRSSGELEGVEVSSMVKLWVRDTDNLPVMLEIVGEAGGIESTTTQEIEYDPTLTIEPPTGS